MSIQDCYNPSNQFNLNANAYFHQIQPTSIVTNEVDLVDVSTPAHDLILKSNSSVALTNNKTMIWDTKNSNMQLSLVSSGNSNLSFRSGTHEVCDLDSSQTLAGKSLVDNTTLIVDNLGISGNAKFRVDSITAATTRQVDFVDSDGVMVIEDFPQTLKQKDLVSSSTILKDGADNTKQMNIDLSNEGAGTKLTLRSNASVNQVSIVPDQGGSSRTFLMDSLPQQISNKQLLAESCQLANTADNSKIVTFNLANMDISNVTLQVLQKTFSNTINLPASGSVLSQFLLGTAANYPQATNINTAVTVANGELSFSITTQTATTAAQGTDSFLVNCNCVSTSQIFLSCRDNGGSLVILDSSGVGAGSFTLNIRNASTAAALASTMIINVLIV